MQTIKDVQNKILETACFIDNICRKNNIQYFIMGGTALGAVRHGGFIPWDDDLDIFMTPKEYTRFKSAFDKEQSSKFIIQEWRDTPEYLEYAKVRMNGTTFIEEHFKDRKDMHHGIMVDIMILHKVPSDKFHERLIFYLSRFVAFHAYVGRGRKAKSLFESIATGVLKLLPCNFLVKHAYKKIYSYDNLKKDFKYCYWITRANFKGGLFDRNMFENPIDIPFEDKLLMGSSRIKDYLEYRYGNYKELPSQKEREASVHAYIFDVNKDYTEYYK